MTHSYQDLVVWQKAMEVAERAYRITKLLPAAEKFALVDQIRRSAVSIPSNIAEGQKRLNRAETIQFCGIVLGSTAELETQLLLVRRLYGIAVDDESGSALQFPKCSLRSFAL